MASYYGYLDVAQIKVNITSPRTGLVSIQEIQKTLAEKAYSYVQSSQSFRGSMTQRALEDLLSIMNVFLDRGILYRSEERKFLILSGNLSEFSDLDFLRITPKSPIFLHAGYWTRTNVVKLLKQVSLECNEFPWTVQIREATVGDLIQINY